MTRGSFQKETRYIYEDIDYDEQVFRVRIVKSVRHPILYDSWDVSEETMYLGSSLLDQCPPPKPRAVAVPFTNLIMSILKKITGILFL